MRASGVRQALIDQIQAITPDSQATHRDRFVALDLRHKSDRGVTVSDRCFVVELAQITPSVLITPNTQTATYEIDVFYMAQDGVEDRIALDAERIVHALYSIHTQDADLYTAEIGPIAVNDTMYENILSATTTVDVTYKTDI